MPLPLKVKIALLFVNPLPGNRARCNAALAKLDRKLSSLELLLATWSQREDDVRYENYRPRVTQHRQQERALVDKAEGSPRSAAADAIRLYRETINPLTAEIQAEMDTPPAAGKITTKTAVDFPDILKVDAAPKWVKVKLDCNVTVQVTGPRDLLDGDAWDEIVEAVSEAVNDERRRAQKLLTATDEAIAEIYDQSTLANWQDLNRLTPEQLEAASAACARSAEAARAKVEDANQDLAVLVDTIAEAGITAARTVIDARLAVRQGRDDYRCAYKKRVALGSLAVVGGAVSLAATVATGGAASFFGIYGLVAAAINVANLVRESFRDLKSAQARLTLNMSTAADRMEAAHGRAEALTAEGLTIVAGLMKIPTDIYGEAVGTIGEMEQSLQLYRDRAETYNEHINSLIQALSELLDCMEALAKASQMGTETETWGITEAEYEEKIKVNEPKIDAMIKNIIKAREAYPNSTKLSMKAQVMISTYSAFTKDQLLEGYESLDAVLGMIGNLKHAENSVMGIATLAGDLAELTTPINAFVPTDIVDALSMISSSLSS